jgi:hypothetical protein
VLEIYHLHQIVVDLEGDSGLQVVGGDGGHGFLTDGDVQAYRGRSE